MNAARTSGTNPSSDASPEGQPSATVPELRFADVHSSDPSHQDPWLNKPKLSPLFQRAEIRIEGAAHEVWLAEATEKRPAVVYAEQKTLTALALVCYQAQGESASAALEQSTRTRAFAYHGGAAVLDGQGFPRGAVVLDKNPRGLTRADALAWGAIIREEFSHAEGKGELPAKLASQNYLIRNGLIIRELSAEQIAAYIRSTGQEPTETVSSEDVLSPNIGPIRPAGYSYRPLYPTPAQPPSAPSQSIEETQAVRAVRPASAWDSVELTQSSSRLEDASPDLQEAVGWRALEAQEALENAAEDAARRAAEQAARESWLRGTLPGPLAALVVPFTRIIYGEPARAPSERKVSAVSGGGISGGLGGRGQNPSQRQRQQKHQEKSHEE